MSFAVAVPSTLGIPDAIIEQDAATGLRSGTEAVALIYAHTAEGQVDVIEAEPTIPAKNFSDELHRMVEQWTAYPSLLHGSFKFVTLDDGTEALITTAEAGSPSDIRWLTGYGIEITVEGPELSLDGSIAIANSFPGVK